MNIIKSLYSILLLLFFIILNACVAAPESASGVSQPITENSQLATAKVQAKLSEPGQVIITGHNNLEYIVYEEDTMDGLSEMSTLLAAQATCAVFVAEKAALELDVPLLGATATTEFNKAMQQVNVYLDLPGANDEQVLELANNFRQRCPVYTTLSEAESVEFIPGEQFDKTKDNSETVIASIFRFGGANVTTGDLSFVMDSVPPLDGPNEELNPLDMMLGGLAACSSFVYHSQAPSADVSVAVEGDFDPSGVRNLEGPNPRIQNLRILMQVSAYDEAQAEQVEEQIKEQCYLYKLLSGTVDIDILMEASET